MPGQVSNLKLPISITKHHPTSTRASRSRNGGIKGTARPHDSAGRQGFAKMAANGKLRYGIVVNIGQQTISPL